MQWKFAKLCDQFYVLDFVSLPIGLQVTCAAAQNLKEDGGPATGEETKWALKLFITVVLVNDSSG